LGDVGERNLAQSRVDAARYGERMDLGFSDRVVIVTGGSRGIGRAAALAFARERARVLITYRTDAGRAQAVVDELHAAGGEGASAFMDLADPASIVAVVPAALERWGRIDVLVNNAVQWGTRGPWEAPAFEHVERDYWRPLLETNVEGYIHAIQAVLPAMRERGFGRIINVSSAIAVDGMPGSAPYAAAKAALHGLTRTLAKELSAAGILTNVVMPGFTLTERNLARITPAMRDSVAATSPIRRLLAPEEVVPIIVFLGSPLNTALTGEIVRASGGIT
jgi:3-oxoacyl-[acyl-carrier protein] reductase